MNARTLVLVAALLFSPLASPLRLQAATKPVLVYYMPWFTARPYSASWGWHWTMGHFDPELRNASGERQLASWYYPLIGPYDSSDPAVLEYHVLLMKLAGVDGVVVDWYGSANSLDYANNNQATRKLFQFTRKAGLRFCLCYEDQTIQHLLDTKYLASGQALAHARQDLLYLQTNYFSDPSYLRLKGAPVLLNFGPQYFLLNTNWQEIFAVLDPTNRPAFFTEDNRLPVGMGAFSWPPMWLSQVPGTGGVLSSAALRGYLREFELKAEGWPAFISSAFPRFHDIYQRAGVRDYWGYLGDAHGDTFRETLSRALTNSSTFAQVVTWNDFGEGTMVEPTREYGYRDLAILQALRRQYLEPSFAATTNDLALPLRFYHCRHQFATNSAVSAELDRIFTNFLSGHTAAASRQLDQLRSNNPRNPLAE